ncbi:MAG: hypothetical protein LBU84_11275 [Prevotella sp.]|jgi:hypothetical protein|nr:hypothetical protein [Prevotella sp.]
MIHRILFLCCLCALGLTTTAQVTIGSGNPSSRAALLELKDHDASAPASVTDDTNVTSETGGLLLPRVKLIDKNTLQPFIDISDEIWDEKETNKIREIHAGLMVYNLSVTAEFEQGIYVWDGAKWMITKTTINNWSLTGNAGTTAGTNFLGTTDAQGLAFKTNNTERIRIASTGNVGIGITVPSASLHVNGDMKLATAPAYSGADVVVRNSDGSIGVAAPEAPINKILYAQSPTYQNISGTDLATMNAGNPIIVTWDANDIQSFGGLLTRNADHSFTFNEKALCEVSGYVNYQPNATPPNYSTNYSEYVAAVNVIIQYATASAPNTWLTLTGARHLYPGATAGGPIQSVLVAPAIRTFQKNDKIRMIVKRPSASFGLAHGTMSASPFAAINVPTGSTYCKSLKVTTM